MTENRENPESQKVNYEIDELWVHTDNTHWKRTHDDFFVTDSG